MSATVTPRSAPPRSGSTYSGSARISKFKSRRGSKSRSGSSSRTAGGSCGKTVSPVSADVAIVVGNSRVIVRCSQVARKQQPANVPPTWTNTFSTADIDAAASANCFPPLVLHVHQNGNRHSEPPYSYYDCI